MKNPAKNRFVIGQWVKVKAYCSLFYTLSNERKVLSFGLSEHVYGKIVGYALRKLGQYSGGINSCLDSDYDAPYLRVTKTIGVWLVALDMMSKPLEVLDEDVFPANPDEIPDELSWKKYKGSVWEERDRQFMREEAKKQPRDSRGRFTKTS